MTTRLRRTDPSRPGITRRRRGRGFEYFAPSGEKITNPDELDRLRRLAIPPAWRDVWICPRPNGHLQALGTDDAGRRQYQYHEAWRTRRDAIKFDHMLEFARRLPDLRSACVEILDRSDKLDRERVLACAIRLLDHGFFRIGTERAVEDGDSVGLTTMRKEHVTIRSGNLVEFDYPAKGQKRRITQLADPVVVDVVGRLRRRRSGGPELLAYRNKAGDWVDVTASDVNEAIKRRCGPDSSAKDFRTWNATVLAAVALAVTGPVDSDHKRTRVITRACREVAHYLGNTRRSRAPPTSTRACSTASRVVGRSVARSRRSAMPPNMACRRTQGEIERAVLDLLEENTDADGVAAIDDLLHELSDAG